MSTAVTTKPKKRIGAGGGGGRRFDGGGGGDGGGPRKPRGRDNYRLGLTFGLASIGMLFVALTSAYVVRHGLDPDWRAIRMPRILWLNTAVLLASSFTLEIARRRASLRWLGATLLLGVAFLGGQLMAWRQLAAQGVYLSTNPHGAFFYLLSGLHGLHLAGGVVALTYTLRRFRWIGVTSLYWHFMDGLWVYLMVLLFGWR